MFATDLVNESVLSYPVRRLQQTTSYVFIYLGMYLSCLVMVFGLIIVIIRSFSTPGSVAALDTTTEFPTDNNTLHKTSRMSTLAERKQAILELFESAQVTMKVSADDIHGPEGSIEDVESGFDRGGILKLSRSVANPTSNASFLSPLPPPEWCAVPNMCAICLDSYQPGQGVAWSSACRHAFHRDCISHYLAKKMIGGEAPCPSCRQRFCELPEEPMIMSASSISGNSATSFSESTEAGTY